MADELIRGLLGSVRVVATVTLATSREAARRHGVVAGAAVALSRAATAALLSATLAKDEERFTLQIVGDGPLGGVTADAHSSGRVRAYLKNPFALVPGGGARRVALGAAIGRAGVVNVVRDLGLKERYSGQASLVTGEIDEDVERYLRVSEQIESALGCEAVLGENLELVAAGGLLVQCMPGAEGAPLVRRVQHWLRTGGLYELITGEPRLGAADLAQRAVGDAALQVLGRQAVEFGCTCSRERVADMLTLLGRQELDEMLAEARPAQVICNFCNELYEVPREELARLVGPRGRS